MRSNSFLLIALLFFFVFNEENKAQNMGSIVLSDSIYPVWESDFEKAKSLLVKYEDQIIPQDMVLILDDILANGDVDFYKDRMTYLMVNYGWIINNLERNKLSALASEIHNNKLYNWTYEASQKHYSVWVKNNMESLLVQEKVKAILHTDQRVRGLLSMSEDSLQLNYIYEMITEIDYNNLMDLCDLSNENDGVLLNDFDTGIAIYNNVLFILWHNLKSEKNFQSSWDLILPFIDKAYFQKKIDASAFEMYDIWSSNHFGYQYYGTLNDTIPVFDSLRQIELKIKYHF
ncbi:MULTISPECIES: hypothetical protein [unclassified Lentimicrobium]|uniref:hypothetical protein n=1 Tax=unclassified Lentimicrobium TaxID=2677434 RepID=UPI001554513D|nr:MULTISPECIES: hypothetical protein [unclassified Lentimicrobium]NPD47540.1 hypothetical protein [Lentimicrobium sp. S6]NPD86831.1 hypothetical protein [Lentimicrobium sp. L6]